MSGADYHSQWKSRAGACSRAVAERPVQSRRRADERQPSANQNGAINRVSDHERYVADRPAAS